MASTAPPARPDQAPAPPEPARACHPFTVRYVRFVLFSFLILIGCFVTLEGMEIKSVTRIHHLMIMVSSVRLA